METHITLPVQELHVSTYNHPCEDLFDGGRRKDYLDIVVPLYRASITGDLKAARNILEDHPNYVNYSINENKETPLHVAVAGRAAAGRSDKFVSYLVDMMSKVDLELQNRNGNTAFCVAAISGKVGVIEIMFKKNPALLIFAVLMLDRTMRDSWTDDSMDEVLMKCIQANIFASVTPPSKKANATLLLPLLWKRIMEKPKDVIDNILRGPMIEKDGKETYPSQILFIAAKMNNLRFLVELIREYPDLVLKRNEDGHTIFHISVSHRHYKIFQLLYETGSMKDLITSMTDQQGNNILHLVGKSSREKWFGGHGDYSSSNELMNFYGTRK
ncbi:hypothetical protein SSX86_004425 [Deinandra increscens subsp. villosa]|uniref:Uncharacterized protein n=1 Tax=Deinandra increscens subsp. villosa TaxID=3103831 RepID=A0AAP0H915_9ASTR